MRKLALLISGIMLISLSIFAQSDKLIELTKVSGEKIILEYNHIRAVYPSAVGVVVVMKWKETKYECLDIYSNVMSASMGSMLDLTLRDNSNIGVSVANVRKVKETSYGGALWLDTGIGQEVYEFINSFGTIVSSSVTPPPSGQLLNTVQTSPTTWDVTISGGNTITIDVSDGDSDDQNEIQDISLVGDQLSITGGSSVILPPDGDSDDQNEIQDISLSTDQLSISGGSTVTIPNIYTFDGTLTGNRTVTGSGNNMIWDGVGDYSIFPDNNFNVFGANQIVLSADNMINLNSPTGSAGFSSQTTTISGGNILSLRTPDIISNGTTTAGNVLTSINNQGHAEWMPLPTFTEVDGDVTNEIQDISLTGDQLSISGGGTVTLPASDNIYTADGTLTGNRQWDGGNFRLNMSNFDRIEMFPTRFSIIANQNANITSSINTSINSNLLIKNTSPTIEFEASTALRLRTPDIVGGAGPAPGYILKLMDGTGAAEWQQINTTETATVGPGATYNFSMPTSHVYNILALFGDPGDLIDAVGTIDPTNVSTNEAALIDGIYTNLCYNNSSVGTTNKELPAIDLGSVVSVDAIDLYWWNATYFATDYRIEVSSDGTTWTDVTGTINLGFIGASTPHNISLGGVSCQYIRLFCEVGNNASWVVVSEIEAYSSPSTPTWRYVADGDKFKIEDNGTNLSITNLTDDNVDFEVNYFLF